MTVELVVPGGLRVVRVLSRDEHIERILVHVADDRGGSPAVVVRARTAEGATRIHRLIAVLDRLEPVGIGGLLDVFDDVHCPSVLIEHRRGEPLVEVIGSKPRLRAGEAVGLLAPIAAAVQQLHDSGVAHGTLGASHVQTCVDGPILGGLETAELFAPGAPEVVRESTRAVVSDREALRAMAADILGRIVGPRRVAADRLVARIDSAQGHELVATLITGLSQLAAATPVSLDEEPSGVEVAPAVAAPEQPTPLPRDGAITALLRSLAVHDLATPLLQAAARLRESVGRMPQLRRRLIVAGSSAVVMAALLLAVLPPSDPPEAETASPPPAMPTPSATAGSVEQEAGMHDEDPADAIVGLLKLREQCFRELSVLCLDGVDQVGSNALQADQQAVLAMREGRERTAPAPTGEKVRIIERLGDSALLEVELSPDTRPASLLMMRSEAGWRIRDWVAGG